MITGHRISDTIGSSVNAEMKAEMECWENLANAIIVQAAKDYRGVLRKMRNCKDPVPIEHEKYELERFFCSRWFRVLSTVNGPALLEALKEEANAGRQ